MMTYDSQTVVIERLLDRGRALVILPDESRRVVRRDALRECPQGEFWRRVETGRQYLALRGSTWTEVTVVARLDTGALCVENAQHGRWVVADPYQLRPLRRCRDCSRRLTDEETIRCTRCAEAADQAAADERLGDAEWLVIQ